MYGFMCIPPLAIEAYADVIWRGVTLTHSQKELVKSFASDHFSYGSILDDTSPSSVIQVISQKPKSLKYLCARAFQTF
jgi:hypothetical protein